MSRVRPLHALAIVVSFAIVAAGVAGWFQSGSDPRGIIIWALGSAIAFEWILLPLAWLLDRIAFGPRTLRPVAPEASGEVRPNRAYLRVPALLSGLLLIVFAPLIFRADTPTGPIYDARKLHKDDPSAHVTAGG